MVSSNPFTLTTEDDLIVGKLVGATSITASSIKGSGIASSGNLRLVSEGDIGSSESRLGLTVDGELRFAAQGNVYLDHTGDLNLWNASLRETLDLKSSGKIDGHMTIEVADDTGAYLRVDAVDNVILGFQQMSIY